MDANEDVEGLVSGCILDEGESEYTLYMAITEAIECPDMRSKLLKRKYGDNIFNLLNKLPLEKRADGEIRLLKVLYLIKRNMNDVRKFYLKWTLFVVIDVINNILTGTNKGVFIDNLSTPNLNADGVKVTFIVDFINETVTEE